MKIFQITFLNTLVKRIAAPNDELFVNFIEPLPHLTDVTSLQNYSGTLDLFIEEDGTVNHPEIVEWWVKQANLIAEPPKNIYEGRRGKKVQVLLNNKKFNPKPSQKVYNHSPDGFEWSYFGSGPAQLALAVLLEETGDPVLSVQLHQQFKQEVIGVAPKLGWAFGSEFVKNWLNKNVKQNTVS